MCYSAQIAEAYKTYLRMTNAEMDLEQFIEIFGARAQGEKITIPRAIERWFEQPQPGIEQRLHDLIAGHRAATITQLEQELFRQRKRLANAERKLAVKETKAATESRRIATDKSVKLVARLNALNDPRPQPADGRIFPMNYAPIVLRENGRNVVRLARYHCRLAGKAESVDREFPGLYNARRDNIERYWRASFGTHHALMLVTSFFENVERDGKNAVLHFIPRPADTMLVACVYSVWKDPRDGKELLSFAAITDEPPAEVAAAGHDRMIVNIKPANIARWLDPHGASLDQLQEILADRNAPYYEHEVMAA